MSFLSSIRSAAAKFFRRSHVEDDMEEELRSHIQHRADDLERLGLHRAEAEQRASPESAQKHIDHLEAKAEKTVKDFRDLEAAYTSLEAAFAQYRAGSSSP